MAAVADTSVIDTPVYARCARECPPLCARCHRQVRWQVNYVMHYGYVGHPWDHDTGAWWCYECLDAASYAIEIVCSHPDASIGTKP